MTIAADLRQKQIEQAEELLFSGPQKEGFAKELFLGKFRAESVLPYPLLDDEQQRIGDEAVAAVRAFAEAEIDPDRIDREEDIPTRVIKGLADVGVLGMTIPRKYGGMGMSQQNYCRVMEVIG
ncbi:MAG: acyl-CoA dehydrogenase family protein, partial [Planctomycetes bacterium]|nr:acyl-CoA dehydrogenase family protein [Planctomycetota bacterium]